MDPQAGLATGSFFRCQVLLRSSSSSCAEWLIPVGVQTKGQECESCSSWKMSQ